ncbi:MAG: hypothetical protein WC455_13845 [Dehalococcoidia bacterium]|jgi:hypothetical protein
MNAVGFANWAESVFGKYLPAMKPEVIKWLDGKDEYFLSALCDICLRDHPSVYGKPPGVHELETMKLDAYKLGHEKESIDKTRHGVKQIESESTEEYTQEEMAEAWREATNLLRKMGMRK